MEETRQISWAAVPWYSCTQPSESCHMSVTLPALAFPGGRGAREAKLHVLTPPQRQEVYKILNDTIGEKLEELQKEECLLLEQLYGWLGSNAAATRHMGSPPHHPAQTEQTVLMQPTWAASLPLPTASLLKWRPW